MDHAVKNRPHEKSDWARLIAAQLLMPLLAALYFIILSRFKLGGSVFGLIGVLAAYGVAYGQIMVAPIATVFGPWPLLYRILLPPLLLAVQISFVLWSMGPSITEVVNLSCAALAIWFVALPPLTAFQCLAGARLCSANESSVRPRIQQVSIRQLLGLMLVLALLLGVGRLVVESQVTNRVFRFNAKAVLTVAVIGTSMIGAALVSLRYLLSRRRLPVEAASSILAVSMIGVALFLALDALRPQGMSNKLEVAIVSIGLLPQHFLILMYFNHLRSKGWQLVRLH